MQGVVFLGDRRCETRQFDKAQPGHGEVLIKIEASGICGSDLHVYRDAYADDQIRGHEPAGTVESVGPGVRRVKVGDRVSVHHHEGCGVCANCARGETVACPHDKVYGVSRPGSFAEYMAAAEPNCIPIPDSAGFVDGSFMACVGTTSYAALRRLQVSAHESLAVFGLGPVGLSAVIVGKALGLRVIGMDIIDERIELAKHCGADAVVNGLADDAVQTIRAFGRIPGIDWHDGIDYVIETSGSAAARECIIPSLKRLGKAAIVGVGSDDKVINPSDIHGRAVTLIGSVVFPLGWSWDFARFIAASGLSFGPAVTHRFSLDRSVEALQTADEGRCGKVVFLPHG